jgi:hypothetical protein
VLVVISLVVVEEVLARLLPLLMLVVTVFLVVLVLAEGVRHRMEVREARQFMAVGVAGEAVRLVLVLPAHLFLEVLVVLVLQVRRALPAVLNLGVGAVALSQVTRALALMVRAL